MIVERLLQVLTTCFSPLSLSASTFSTSGRRQTRLFQATWHCLPPRSPGTATANNHVAGLIVLFAGPTFGLAPRGQDGVRQRFSLHRLQVDGPQGSWPHREFEVERLSIGFGLLCLSLRGLLLRYQLSPQWHDSRSVRRRISVLGSLTVVRHLLLQRVVHRLQQIEPSGLLHPALTRCCGWWFLLACSGGAEHYQLELRHVGRSRACRPFRPAGAEM